MSQYETKYFDLHIQGIGYLNRVREVKPSRSEPFWATDIAAIFGSADNVQRTRFDCRVVGTEAKRVIAHAKKHVDADRKVLVAFKLGDLYAETFTFEKGDKAGTTGISLKARLLRIDWVKVDGETVYSVDLCSGGGAEGCGIHGLKHYKIRAYPHHQLLARRFECGRMLWI